MPTIESSALDQHAPREYHRFALVFACKDGTDPASMEERLQTIVKKTVSELPVLAGTVQDGNKVSVDQEQIDGFAATIVSPDVTDLDYAAICAAGFPPGCFTAEKLLPLSGPTHLETGPVADIKGITNILRTMSEPLPSRTLTGEDLLAETEQASACRRIVTELSGPVTTRRTMESSAQQQRQPPQQALASQEMRTDTNIAPRPPHADDMGSAIFMFKLSHLTTIAETINGRRAQRHSGPGRLVLITPKQVLMALCWRAITRTKYPHRIIDDSHNFSISFGSDLRNVMNLEADYFGNAEVIVKAEQSINKLILPYDPTTIESSVDIISTAQLEQTRNSIGLSPVSAGTTTGENLTLIDWSGTLERVELDLGLGLGRPICVRRMVLPTRGNEACVIMPPHVWTQTWEVQIEIPTLELNAMRQDEELMKFVWAVAGSRGIITQAGDGHSVS